MREGIVYECISHPSDIKNISSRSHVGLSLLHLKCFRANDRGEPAIRAMPHNQHETGSCDWRKATPNYHTWGRLKEGNMTWRGIFVKQTTMRGALETRGLWKKQPWAHIAGPFLAGATAPCSPTLHPPPRDIPTTTTLLGRGILVSAPKAVSKVKLFPTALCRSSSNFVPHSVTWLYLPYRPS